MHKLVLGFLIATIVINIIAITMKNYTVAIVFSSIYIAYVLSVILTTVVMNPQKRARINPFGNAITVEGGPIFRSSIRPRIPNQDPNPNDPQPNMEPVDTSLFPQTYRTNPPQVPGPQSTDGGSARWSTSSYDTVGDDQEWDLNTQAQNFKNFMKNEKL
ncbi:putative membrane protein [Emiliania huxleyi virus 18]|nr:putative membrane protein [Emiliania huxleyi virus 18]